ncbi:hypothetical protein TNCV_2557491 [Trichonephila clavipes]|nr:hypothetical protein TNCV_2557491 [Trichonephila clavipes]
MVSLSIFQEHPPYLSGARQSTKARLLAPQTSTNRKAPYHESFPQAWNSNFYELYSQNSGALGALTVAVNEKRTFFAYCKLTIRVFFFFAAFM